MLWREVDDATRATGSKQERGTASRRLFPDARTEKNKAWEGRKTKNGLGALDASREKTKVTKNDKTLGNA